MIVRTSWTMRSSMAQAVVTNPARNILSSRYLLARFVLVLRIIGEQRMFRITAVDRSNRGDRTRHPPHVLPDHLPSLVTIHSFLRSSACAEGRPYPSDRSPLPSSAGASGGR